MYEYNALFICITKPTSYYRRLNMIYVYTIISYKHLAYIICVKFNLYIKNKYRIYKFVSNLYTYWL